MNNKQLYNKIMRNISKLVMRTLNESIFDDEDFDDYENQQVDTIIKNNADKYDLVSIADDIYNEMCKVFCISSSSYTYKMEDNNTINFINKINNNILYQYKYKENIIYLNDNDVLFNINAFLNSTYINNCKFVKGKDFNWSIQVKIKHNNKVFNFNPKTYPLFTNISSIDITDSFAGCVTKENCKEYIDYLNNTYTVYYGSYRSQWKDSEFTKSLLRVRNDIHKAGNQMKNNMKAISDSSKAALRTILYMIYYNEFPPSKDDYDNKTFDYDIASIQGGIEKCVDLNIPYNNFILYFFYGLNNKKYLLSKLN